MNRKVVVWGASGHALVVAEIIRLQGIYELYGFLDDFAIPQERKEFLGYPLLGGRDQLEAIHQLGVRNMILAFGDCGARLEIAQLVRSKGFSLVTGIHPSAVVSGTVEIGQGTVVAARAVINPGTRVGENVIINTAACVDHECIVENGVHLCPGVCLGGSVIVGRGAWIGIGSTVSDHVRIGAGAVLGAGAVAVRDIPESVLAYGVPARVIRSV